MQRENWEREDEWVTYKERDKAREWGCLNIEINTAL